jgi:hypothetical protein
MIFLNIKKLLLIMRIYLKYIYNVSLFHSMLKGILLFLKIYIE